MLRSVLLGLALASVLTCAGAVSAANASRQTRALLDRNIPSINFEGVTLRDALDFLRDVSGANLHVNWRALKEAGIEPDTQINIRLRQVALRKVLSMVLSEAAGGVNLTFYLEDGVIEVTTRALADAELITIVYPVQDLLVEAPDVSVASMGMMGGGMYGGGMMGGYGGGMMGGYGGGMMGGYGGGMMGGYGSGMMGGYGGYGGMTGGYGGYGGYGGGMSGGYGRSGYSGSGYSGSGYGGYGSSGSGGYGRSGYGGSSYGGSSYGSGYGGYGSGGYGSGGYGSGGYGGGSGYGGYGGSAMGLRDPREKGQELVDLIVEVIEPDSWIQNGGKASIRFFNGNLVITAPRSIHEQIGGPVD